MNKKGLSYWLDLFKDKTAVIPSTANDSGSLIRPSLQRSDKPQLIDAKTGLLDEIPFRESEKKLISLAERNSLSSSFTEIYMDIDNFKLYNEDFGYIAGDDTLSKVGKAILSVIKTDDIAGRVGGEELAVITTQTSQAISIENKDLPLAETIRRAIQDQQLSTGRPVTVSIGMAEYIKGESLESFRHRLHNAERVAKRKGKNRVVVSLIVDNKEVYQDWSSNKTYTVTRDKKSDILQINEVQNG
jgi:diguanylate cyclase (GGDEF)-like protein